MYVIFVDLNKNRFYIIIDDTQDRSSSILDTIFNQ